MTFASIIALIQSVGGFHLLFSLLSALLPQASKDKPLWYVVRSLIDWAALNIGNAENKPKAWTLPGGWQLAAPSEKVSEKEQDGTSKNSPSTPQPVKSEPIPVVDNQAGDGSDVPKFPN